VPPSYLRAGAAWPCGLRGRGRPPRPTFIHQVLATVLHLRVNLAAEPLAVLFGSSRTAMHRTLLKIRRLGTRHQRPTGNQPTRRPRTPPGPGHRSEQRPQQQDQDDMFMICKS
jgi:hypothetical protein